jgi:hypothetical protein
MAAHRARSRHRARVTLLSAEDLETGIGLCATSKEADQPVVDDGQGMRVIAELRCQDPGARRHPGAARGRARRGLKLRGGGT